MFPISIFLSSSMIFSILLSFAINLWYWSSFINPTSYPCFLNLKSALSCLNNNRYSALDVKSLYGSLIPLVTKSSINTPMYASFLFNINGSFPSNFKHALIPAINPWQAASSYPLVPLICPAVNKFSIFFVSKLLFN